MKRVLCSAGAGTGKTYSLCDEIERAVVQERLDPARILGATFTVKAAAELKGRVQERLLQNQQLPLAERVAKAERLELAALGTVHSVGLRLLQQHALRLGLSPELQVMDEPAAGALLDEAIGLMPYEPWDVLARAGLRLGIEDPKRLAKALLGIQRTNRLSDAAVRDGLLGGAERVCELLSPNGPDPAAGQLADLKEHAQRALDGLDALPDATAVTGDAKRRLRDLVHRDRRLWRDMVECLKLKASKKSGADGMLDPLRSFAAGVRRTPELHEDVQRYARLLAEQTLGLRQAYEGRKKERGLLDFADLEALFLDLLEDPAGAAAVKASFDLVIVDEFQDTNPLQLAIFTRLHGLIGNSVWVGDKKQAIYGFRGADSELMEDVWSGGEPVFGARPGVPDLVDAMGLPGDVPKHLDTNYRSQAGLVGVFNALFVPAFGEEAKLKAHHPAKPGGVERWRLGTKKLEGDYAAVAAGVLELRAEGTPLSGIAILARTNAHARQLGDALRAAGIPAIMPLPGLLARRECAMALAGLRVVADARDGVACAEVLHLLADGAQEPAWLEHRLREVRDGQAEVPFAGDPVLGRLRALPARTMAPADALAAVLGALDLPARIAAWGEPDRRAANLDAMLELARVLEQRALEQGRVPTLTGLVADLRHAEEAEQDHHPLAHGLDAVTVMTYHGAKGLEWPVVVLTDLDMEPKPDPWRATAVGGNPRAGKPLEGRTLRAWLWPFGTSSGRFPKRVLGSGLEDDALDAPEGRKVVAADTEEARRLLYVGMTRAQDRLVLAHRWDGAAVHQWLDVFEAASALLPAHLDPGEHPIPGCATTLRIRDLQPAAAQDGTRSTVWMREPILPRHEVPRHRAPSAELPMPAVRAHAPLAVGARVPVLGAAHDDYEALGRAVHAYLGALPSLRGLPEEMLMATAERCLRGSGATTWLSPADLIAAGHRLEAWVEERYAGAAWHVELSATAPSATGAQWNGNIDLLLELPDGAHVIIDHKVAPLPVAMLADKAKEFSGQLAAYGEMLTRQGRRVEACWVHFPLAGALVLLELDVLRAIA
ncbi:MAG: UvrD-helicase domain-containing protein [Halobacteriales archaeon]|nr:UvrD-helicase domain-containing protein [Halobacteriales archaeon]